MVTLIYQDGKTTANLEHNSLFDMDDANEQVKQKEKSFRQQSIHAKICQPYLKRYIILLSVIIILLLIISAVVFCVMLRKISSNKVPIEKIYISKEGNAFGNDHGGDASSNDAERAALTFNETITCVTASYSSDLNDQPLLVSLTFTYSNGKTGVKYGGIGIPERGAELGTFDLNPEERFNQVTVYEDDRNITNSWRPGQLTHIIVGIRLQTNQGGNITFGSVNGTSKTESFANFFLGYVQGRSGSHIDSLRFTWYKVSLINSAIIEGNS